ncbi:MAG: caspase family protein [Cyanobacteriota bacterium]|nr:caspase family protein [Cyanobacteriota bacterium]
MPDKHALLVGISTYGEGLQPIPSARLDVEALRKVLVDPELGGIPPEQVQVLINPDRKALEGAIESFYLINKHPDDLLLFYFSGHGFREEDRELLFSTTESQRIASGGATSIQRSTTLSARALRNDYMERSRSDRQVVILDCCFSGAFVQGMTVDGKGLASTDGRGVAESGTLAIDEMLGGKGRAVLTSSDAIETSRAAEHGEGLSVYTRFLVEGIQTGAADRKRRFWLDAEDVHDYTKARVLQEAPTMTPQLFFTKDAHRIRVCGVRRDPSRIYRQEVQKRADRRQGDLSTPLVRAALDVIRMELHLSTEVAQHIEAEVMQPFHDYHAKLERYRQTIVHLLADKPASSTSLSTHDREDLLELERLLKLLRCDVDRIHQQVGIGQAAPPLAESTASRFWRLPPPGWAIGLASSFALLAVAAGLLALRSLRAESTLSKLETLCWNPVTTENRISCGDLDFMVEQEPSREQDGREQLRSKDYQGALNNLRIALNDKESGTSPVDPSLKVAYNNAEVLLRLQKIPTTKVYSLAITVPYSNIWIANGILAGVAEKQYEFNQHSFGHRLFVIMADDQNNARLAARQAKTLEEQKFILAMIGSYSSLLTYEQIKQLNGKDLVFLSATSTASQAAFQQRHQGPLDLSHAYRTVSSTAAGAKKLVAYLKSVRPRHNNILLLYQSGNQTSHPDLFVNSYHVDLSDQLKRAGFSTHPQNASSTEEATGIDISTLADDEIVRIIQRFKAQQLASAGDGPLVIAAIPNAYREDWDRLPKILLSQNRRAEFLILAASPFFNPELLNKELMRSNAKLRQSLIIDIPWYPDPALLPKGLRKDLSQVGWHFGPAYDATAVLDQALQALINSNPNQPVNRDVLQRQLQKSIQLKTVFVGIGDSRFQLIPFERVPAQNALVSPECLQSRCFWRRIDRQPPSSSPP